MAQGVVPEAALPPAAPLARTHSQLASTRFCLDSAGPPRNALQENRRDSMPTGACSFLSLGQEELVWGLFSG